MSFICTWVQPDGRHKCRTEKAIRGLMIGLRAIDEITKATCERKCSACGGEFVCDCVDSEKLCLRCREMVRANIGGLAYCDVSNNAIYVIHRDPTGYRCQFAIPEGILKDTSEIRMPHDTFFYQGQRAEGQIVYKEGIMIWPEAK